MGQKSGHLVCLEQVRTFQSEYMSKAPGDLGRHPPYLYRFAHLALRPSLCRIRQESFQQTVENQDVMLLYGATVLDK